MDDQQLAEIRERDSKRAFPNNAEHDRRALLAEVDRLRAKVAAVEKAITKGERANMLWVSIYWLRTSLATGDPQ